VKILLVGESPFGTTGNSRMCFAIASQLNSENYDVRIFTATKPIIIPDYYIPTKHIIIEGIEDPYVPLCGNHLCQIIASNKPDIVIFVGLDCWAYHKVFNILKSIHKENKFIWISLFPYDLIHFRKDWLYYLNEIDIPLVYSKYGYNQLKEYLPKVEYFRPPLLEANTFVRFNTNQRIKERQQIFPSVSDDSFIFGFIGANQWRKDPLRLVKAFMEVKQQLPNTVLYMHTEQTKGVFNIPSYLIDLGAKSGDVFIKPADYKFSNLISLYNSIDCLVNTSLQEGLSWTLLEAMLCKTPIIAANNTAQTELLTNSKNEYTATPIACTELAYIPMQSPGGQISVETRACNLDQLIDAMLFIAKNPKVRITLAEKGHNLAIDWVNNISNVNDVISNASKIYHTTPITKKKKAVLFAQHGSAGDVLMTTQCFKGIFERHKHKPIVYMTQPQFKDIIENNPYISEIIDWDESKLKEYDVVYNPHGDHILKGNFNRLDVTLYSLYPYFCNVKPDQMYIDKQSINFDLPEKYIIVHTTGGEPKYRTYNHMEYVVNKLKYPCIQIGSATDKYVKGTFLDLRGKLTFRQAAFVMEKAKLAIVIDSFPSHLAGACNTNAVVLYGPAPARVVKPRSENTRMIHLEPNYLKVCKDLGGCWSSPMNPCTTPCINSISPMIIIQSANKLLDEKE